MDYAKQSIIIQEIVIFQREKVFLKNLKLDKIKKLLGSLSAGLCDAFDFVAFSDCNAFYVFVSCQHEFVGEGFLDAAWVVFA